MALVLIYPGGERADALADLLKSFGHVVFVYDESSFMEFKRAGGVKGWVALPDVPQEEVRAVGYAIQFYEEALSSAAAKGSSDCKRALEHK